MAVKFIAALFALLVIGDLATTLYGFSAGAVESGDIQAPVYAALGWTGIIVVKVIPTALMLALIWMVDAKWRWLAAIPGGIALSMPLAHNVAQLASLR